jgi:hypothetical protein
MPKIPKGKKPIVKIPEEQPPAIYLYGMSLASNFPA